MRERKSLFAYAPSGKIRISGDIEIINEVLNWCDGNHDINQILDKANTALDIDKTSVIQLITDLANRGVISDVTNASLHAVRFWNNPSPWFRPVTEDELVQIQSDSARECNDGIEGEFHIYVNQETLFGLAEKRQSTRNFGTKPVNADKLRSVIAAGFGPLERKFATNAGIIPARTIPSGGALYPIRIFVSIFTDNGDIPAGNYQLSGSGQSLVPIGTRHAELFDAIGADNITGMPYCAITFVCDVTHSARKYNNRAVMFAVLEAGHAAQNVELEATRLNLASLEWGGLNESAFVAIFNLNWPIQFPTISVLLGSKYDLT